MIDREIAVCLPTGREPQHRRGAGRQRRWRNTREGTTGRWLRLLVCLYFVDEAVTITRSHAN